jgi:calpain-7
MKVRTACEQDCCRPVQMQGTFTSKTGGGNSTYPTFMVNPQYEMIIRSPPSRTATVGNKASVTLNLQSKKDVPVNVAMVWSQGSRVTE